eukprot:TRINITY_DN4246_c0_g1_i1.p1 TRINITY_DN4246_c0_g1~~TRINITY_DN4246_c0_g1_i1.p1  ORF type:complete len:218 (-),score=70.98 TRINITY_DN4246_c0_g1_i1:100-753(-)
MFSWFSSDPLTKALETATVNDDFKPLKEELDHIALLSFENPESLTKTLGYVFKRLDDPGKYWRRIYKALLILERLVHSPEFESSHMSDMLTEMNRVRIKTLQSFQHTGTFDDKDIGMSIRGKAKGILLYLEQSEMDDSAAIVHKVDTTAAPAPAPAPAPTPARAPPARAPPATPTAAAQKVDKEKSEEVQSKSQQLMPSHSVDLLNEAFSSTKDDPF